MSTTAGAFDETALLNVRARIESFPKWDINVQKQYMAFADTAKTILKTQTAKFVDLENPKKDKTIDVEWVNACEITDQACSGCTMDGTKLSTNIQSYTMNLCREVPFYVDENDMIGNDFDVEDLIAKGFLKADKAIAEYVNGQAIAVIESNLGVNAMGTGGKGVVTGTETYINAAYWDAKLMAYFERVRQLNMMQNPYILDGSNLFEQIFGSKLDTDKKDSNYFGTLDYFYDLSGIDAANTPNLKTYLIERGALTLASKIYYPQLVTYFDSKRYSIKSQLLPGVSYDVYYSNTCTGNFYKHNFKVVFHGLVAAAPTGCTSTNTGLLSFTCGVTP